MGSSATLGTDTTFMGSIIVLQSITLTTSATLEGRALDRNGAVTLDTNNVSAAGCNDVADAGAGPEADARPGQCPYASGSMCEGKPVDLNTDRANCGSCGNVCAEKTTCVEGSCVCT